MQTPTFARSAFRRFPECSACHMVTRSQPIRRSFHLRHFAPRPQLAFPAPASRASYDATRSFSHTHISRAQTVASPAPAALSSQIRVIPPDIAKLRADEDFGEDTELLSEEDARVVLTDDAIHQLNKISAREPPDTPLALRLAVESGGCHGYQYKMELTEERGVDDYVFQPPGERCIPVVVDLISLGLLKGSTLHFATELIGSSFRLQDNPQAKEGGACGCGVSWEANI